VLYLGCVFQTAEEQRLYITEAFKYIQPGCPIAMSPRVFLPSPSILAPQNPVPEESMSGGYVPQTGDLF
jgi:hypothetical protein